MILRYKDAMLEIEDQVAKGRYSAACRNLEALLERNADVNGGLRLSAGIVRAGAGQYRGNGKSVGECRAWDGVLGARNPGPDAAVAGSRKACRG